MKIRFVILIIIGISILVYTSLVYRNSLLNFAQNLIGTTPKTQNQTVNTENSPSTLNSTPVASDNTQTITEPSPYGLVFLINDFKNRITKKPFGIYITPKTSPVQPERFTGYHTGVDIEYQDITSDVPAYAIFDGKIVFSSGNVSGYGGVFIIEIQLNGQSHNILYGHIRPGFLPKVGQTITKGDQIGLLGTGYSSETDGERRHLHFAILSDNRIDLKGYVQTQTELSGWENPLDFYN